MSKLSSELARMFRKLADMIKNQADEIENNPHLSEDAAAGLIEGINYVLENLMPSQPKPLNNEILFIPDAGEIQAKKKGKKQQIIDIFSVFAKEGKSGLSTKLKTLDVLKLKKIISEHRFDPAGLAIKWKNKGRLINRILTRVESRSKKGDVFRKY